MTATGEPRPLAPPRRRSGGAILARGCWLYVVAIAAGFVGILVYAIVVGLIHGDDVDHGGFIVGGVLAHLAGTLLAILVLPAWLAARRRRRASPPPA